MITAEKLNIYRRYGGDIDAFARCGTAIEKHTLCDEEWLAIRDILQRLLMDKSGFAAASFVAETTDLLMECCVDAAAVQMLRRLADEEDRRQ